LPGCDFGERRRAGRPTEHYLDEGRGDPILLLYEGAGHFLQEDKGKELAETIAGWL
jgi:hypothetical protein